MAQPTNTYDSFDQVGIREDLSDKIYNLDPEETPWLSSMKKGKAKNYLHEWQTDSLRASADNATIEGDDLTARAITPTARPSNYVQIFSDAITVTTGDDGLDKAGRGKEMAYQVTKAVKELKLDAERALFLNNAKVAGNSTTPRELAGAQTWMTTNTDGGSGASDPTGDGSDTRTAGTARALTQTIFDSVMQSCWTESGGTPRDVYLSAGQMNVVLGFTGMNNQRSTLPASRDGKNAVVNAVDVYVTPWGNVMFKLSRECPASEVFVIDPKMWECAEKIPMRNFELAKTGLSEKRGFEWEWTLVAKNEKSSGLIADLS